MSVSARAIERVCVFEWKASGGEEFLGEVPPQGHTQLKVRPAGEKEGRTNVEVMEERRAKEKLWRKGEQGEVMEERRAKVEVIVERRRAKVEVMEERKVKKRY
ncbi:hypothetical protein Pmani_031193 [Petrolisthes manimaculis]|uniref:Uncharacterized protein n=1 Tax=Petrolisthes manimaculis TaxID=1843537 RepID=A0AAE1NW83_9EUCA|nr:hypothetical protein Pmani_031193 [Petrolisthes manimaculis]